jgi:hypothetical protein
MDEPANPVSADLREKFQATMLSSDSTKEREAAARALVGWPPDHYQLRVAEWGLWLENQGNLGLSKAIADEIPPFVHRTGNALSGLDSYFRYPSIVTKPVVHLTSDVSMSADIEVEIHQGRPWFAYPYPDDFAIGQEWNDGDTNLGVRRWRPPCGASDPPELFSRDDEVLTDAREGYPWLTPHHRVHSAGWGPGVYGVGCHWQSLIISPKQLPWMALPQVSDDARFQWWKRLRQVPSDWVSSRGETERFLYYDGPTRSRTPVRVTFDIGRRALLFMDLQYRPAPEGSRPEELLAHQSPVISVAVPRALPAREGLYVEVNGTEVAGQRFNAEHDSLQPLAAELPIHGDAVTAEFRKMIIDYGLTEPESDGLIATWSPWLFHAPGKRFILRMSPADYDRQCPMRVRPAPTEVVRLGLVLSEFGPDAAQPSR